MATEHRNIPDVERHEPKGISTAAEGQVYRSDGSASGDWKDDIICLTGTIADVSAPSSIIIPIPVDCIVLSVKATLSGAITVSNSIITVTRGGDSASLGTFNVPFTSSAEGTTVDFIPSGNETLTAATHNYLKFATDGASTDTQRLFISVKLKVIE